MLTRRDFVSALGASMLCTSAWARDTNVRIGVCTRDISGAAKYDFDYIEPSAADIAAMSEDQFREFAATVSSSPLRCEAFNGLIRRPELKVVGGEVNTSALLEYLEECLARCRKLGAAIVVWGSAGSRNVPEGFPRDRAEQQIVEFLRMAADVARRHDLIVAIEPLRHQESNILNTGAQALAMVHRVHHPNVRMIIDYFHLREENEDLQIVLEARRELAHIHFANPHGRAWPHDLAEDDHYRQFFSYLRKINYSGRISIEARGSVETDGAASRAFFRAALA